MQSDIFRREAIEHHAGPPQEGEILLMLPGWTRWGYRLLLSAAAGAAVFIALGSITQYAEGPAVIRADDRVAVTATAPAIVMSVEARSRMRVAAGDPLVRLRSTEEEAQLASLQREFDASLVRMLADPLDRAARQAVAGLRAQKDLLTARLAERVVRAPEAGVVGDVRVRPGQNIAPGELIVSMAREHTRFSVLALLPGQQRPQLQSGLPLRIEVAGYPYVYQTLTIDHVDDEVVGPLEVRRMLGPELADAVPVSGPVVVVHAALRDAIFVSGGETYRYHDGMHATAQAQVRRERLITTLMPGIKVLTEPLR